MDRRIQPRAPNRPLIFRGMSVPLSRRHLADVYRIALAFALSVAWPEQSAAQDPKATTLEEIVLSWKVREERVRSLAFTCTGTEFASKRLIDRRMLEMTGQGGQHVPSRDVSFPVTISLVVDSKDRARWEYSGKVWSAKQNEYIPKTTVYVCDSEVRQVYSPQGTLGYPFLSTGKSDLISIYRDQYSWPILAGFRILDQRLGIPEVKTLVLTRERGVVGDRSCLVLKHPEGRLWVDPGRSFLPLRHYTERGGATVETVDIAYAPNAAADWIPSSWTVTRFSPKGDVLSSVAATTTEYKINHAITDETFRIDCPAGTWVNNNLTNETYLTRPGGRKRLITPGEYTGDNYQQLLETDPPGSGRRLLGLFLLGSCFLTALAVVFRRRLTKGARPVGP